jgi:trigger factor
MPDCCDIFLLRERNPLGMKIQVEQNEACEALLTVEVDPPEVEAAMHKAAQRMSEKSNLPGFRKGKAPYSVVVNAYGEDAILDEALDSLGPETYRKALEEQAIEPSAVGTMKRIISRSPLTLEFLVPVKPLVDIAEYRSVRSPFEEPVIPEEDVEKTLEQLRESQSILEPVNRPAQKGDVLLAEVHTFGMAENKPPEPLVFDREENPQELVLDENLGGRYPGAGPLLEGISEGDSRNAEILYPDSFPISRLRGLRVQLKVKCLGVKVRQIPEWGEEVVKAVSEFSSLDDLRAHVRTRLQTRATDSREEEYADSVIDKMVEGATIKFPAALLEEEIDEEIQTLARRLEQRKTSLEVYLRTIPDGMAGLRKQLEPDAQRKLIRRLLLTELVKRENLEPSAEEIDAQMRVYQSVISDSPKSKARKKDSVEETLRQLAANDVLTRLIVKRVVAIGRGTAPDLPPSS